MWEYDQCKSLQVVEMVDFREEGMLQTRGSGVRVSVEDEGLIQTGQECRVEKSSHIEKVKFYH